MYKDPVPVPPRPIIGANATIRDRNMVISAYYERNKAAIIEEWEGLGKPKSLPRWHISQASMNGLKKRWGLEDVQTRLDRQRKEKIPLTSPSKVALRTESSVKTPVFPMFPAFSDSWPEPVQIKWFDTYVMLQGVKVENRSQPTTA
ncbi:MAG: hypothetical protein PHU23_00235 [Dehalococcoidales bacterium]|nr:hypothetical protein [Dehalococcoidales bacterium]